MELGQELLAFQDLRTKEVVVPVWKRTVTIREMGLHESLSAFGPEKVSADGKINLGAMDIARVVAFGVISPESGERVFRDEDIPALAKKSRTALMYLYTEIMALSGSVEAATKN